MAKENEKATGESAKPKRAPKPTTLRIEKVAGGLARVRNSAGGTPPLKFKGLFTDMTRLQAEVEAHNQGK